MRHVGVVSVFCIILTAAPGGRPREECSVKFDLGNPRWDATGKRILASGSFSVETGYSLVEVKLMAFPPAGGRGGMQSCSLEAGGSRWLGRIDATGFPSGTDYNVFAILTVVDHDGESHHYNSRTVTVRIP